MTPAEVCVPTALPLRRERRQMNNTVARLTVALVVVVAVAGAVFRVSTAPDRIKDRRDTARAVCLASGGQWVKPAGDELCMKADSPK
jgi:hypothetical protein